MAVLFEFTFTINHPITNEHLYYFMRILRGTCKEILYQKLWLNNLQKFYRKLEKYFVNQMKLTVSCKEFFSPFSSKLKINLY